MSTNRPMNDMKRLRIPLDFVLTSSYILSSEVAILPKYFKELRRHPNDIQGQQDGNHLGKIDG